MGYWPAKLIAVLNAILMVGYGVISCIIAGQMLSAVNGGHMTIIVGIVVAAIIIGLVALFGISVLHVYERYIHTYIIFSAPTFPPSQNHS